MIAIMDGTKCQCRYSQMVCLSTTCNRLLREQKTRRQPKTTEDTQRHDNHLVINESITSRMAFDELFLLLLKFKAKNRFFSISFRHLVLEINWILIGGLHQSLSHSLSTRLIEMLEIGLLWRDWCQLLAK